MYESREIEALKILWKKGGRAAIGTIARGMRASSDYGRVVLLDLGKKDYIDITREGMCKITEKGKTLLKNRGILDQIEREKREKKAYFVEKKAEEKRPKTIALNY